MPKFCIFLIPLFHSGKIPSWLLCGADSFLFVCLSTFFPIFLLPWFFLLLYALLRIAYEREWYEYFSSSTTVCLFVFVWYFLEIWKHKTFLERIFLASALTLLRRAGLSFCLFHDLTLSFAFSLFLSSSAYGKLSVVLGRVFFLTLWVNFFAHCFFLYQIAFDIFCLFVCFSFPID